MAEGNVIYRGELLATSNEAAAVAWENADATSGDVGEAVSFLARAIAAGLNGVRVAIVAGLAPERPPELTAEAAPPLATWAYVELMGHRVIVGHVEADELAGRGMLRIRRLVRAKRDPGVGEPSPPLELEAKWKLYSPAAVYSFEPIHEDEARDRFIKMFGAREYNDELPF